MKKFLKKCKEYFAPVDKIFLIGFTALTIATSDLTLQWLVVTFLGYSFILWQIRRGK